MAFSLIGCVKLGQPVRESNLIDESNRGVSQQIQLYLPGSCRLQSSPLKARSVPCCRVMRNCSGVSRAFHSASVFSTLLSGVGLPLFAKLRTSFQLSIYSFLKCNECKKQIVDGTKLILFAFRQLPLGSDIVTGVTIGVL